MNVDDLARARTEFLDKVEDWAPGQAKRFAPVLDELIRWAEENAWGVRFTRHDGIHKMVKFCVLGVETPFWAVVARTGDGAKLTMLNNPHPRIPDGLREEARGQLARIDGKEPKPDGVPEVAFTKLIWPPYRQQVLDLMTRLLNVVHGRV
jgi:hypothetical protein